MTNVKLIADAGSTKVEWVALGEDGSVVGRIISDGINALLAEIEDVEFSMKNVREQLGQEFSYKEVHYYGAGCATDRVCNKMSEILKSVWDVDSVYVYSDLLGASRALFGNKRGIACILGTGSNSCLYDGKKIDRNVPSLGYVLGDEGSGAALGKRLVSDAFKNQLPDKIREEFLEEYSISLTDILDRVYRTPSPNKFLASLVPFIKKNIWNPYLFSLVHQELTSFIKRNVAMYPGAHSMPIGFMGSIAVVFEDILRDAASKQGYEISTILKAPMDGLIDYHRQ
ncbi:MAG: ATPase [Muribaculaceae bacterium]|nr:ATPase [Muribaculaceae bacterium]